MYSLVIIEKNTDIRYLKKYAPTSFLTLYFSLIETIIVTQLLLNWSDHLNCI